MECNRTVCAELIERAVAESNNEFLFLFGVQFEHFAVLSEKREAVRDFWKVHAFGTRGKNILDDTFEEFLVDDVLDDVLAVAGEFDELHTGVAVDFQKLESTTFAEESDVLVVGVRLGEELEEVDELRTSDSEGHGGLDGVGSNTLLV